MASRITNSAGTSFNTAANWDEGWTTQTVHASTNITITSGGVFSATLTAPNTTNAATGVVVKCAAKGTAGTITATLQENSAGWVDVASVTINITALVAQTDVFFRFTTPYVFTATTANFYRIKLNTTGASGTTTMAADSGAANFSLLCFMNSNAVPSGTDDVFVISPNQASALTIELDASPSFGAGTNTSVPSFRSVGNALTLSNNGILSWQTATSRTATVMGNVLIQNAGELRRGTSSAPIAAGITARLALEQNGASVNYGIVKLAGGKYTSYDTEKTYKKTTLSSGVGTAASPFVAADSVDWSVGDELVFVPVSNNAANYDETEVRFIITKNSATSYVLSATSGGAEAAFTYSHAAGTVFNLTRGVKTDTTDITEAFYADLSAAGSASDVTIHGERFETYGSSTANKTTIIFTNLAAEDCVLDDAVFYRGQAAGVNLSFSTTSRTHTWLIFYDHNGVGNSGAFQCNVRNKTFENCYCIDSQSAGFFPVGASALTFTNCASWACGRASSTAYGGWYTQVFSLTITGCESHANRTYGWYMSNTALGNSINGATGTKGTNGVSDFYTVSDAFVDMAFENMAVGSATLISNYLSSAPGSVVAFHKLNTTTNTHRWYTAGGIGRSTGAGLADTTTLKTGHLSARLDPEDSTIGVSFETRVLARVGQAAQIFGMIQKNASMAADEVTVNLYLPGSTTPDDTYVMPTDTAINVFTVAAPYTGSEPFYARVVVNAKSTTAGAYAYIGNFFNGTDVLNAFDLWYRGRPSDVMVEQAGDSQAVWAVLNSTLTTAGTTGKTQADTLTQGKFLALK